MENKPLKRHAALQPLSREHHFALLLCWKIRKGLQNSVDPERIGAYVKEMWKHQLSEHFELEEKFLYPIIGHQHEYILDAIADHRLLKWLILLEPFTTLTLARIEKNLASHIRLEERVIFPEIQKVATEEQLEIVEKVHDVPIQELVWDDPFWNN
ncbi:hemerythrin domain-containing protein [Sphingobacterium lactis]|uniref:hemerythrin domain-containing protein n=1 Tax=Sphingobacterium lactis TaxID=797291 RepID=UPI003F80162E